MLWTTQGYGFLVLHILVLLALCTCHTRWRWSSAIFLLTLGFVVALGLLGLYFLPGSHLLSSHVFSTHITNLSHSTGWFNVSPVSLLVMVLISFIGMVVVRYAQRNLMGDPDSARFLVWYLRTLLAVGITVTTNHLVVFALAWIAISLCLHKLLLFYPERPRAALAAHKKFLFARLSETLLLLAFGILFYQHKSFAINLILEHYQSSAAQPLAQVAAVLLALVALIKCAQLPLHGWLIQVVEAPTPVSALLHAGIINLGGFLLLLFSPLLTAAPVAQWLLLIVAGLSCVIAALIMMTRISIKVKLAWSTIAQMGLMLIECALGLYELALLHLLAHSCYKANAFLNYGEAVNKYLRKQYTHACQPALQHWLAAIACVAIAFGLAIAISGAPDVFSPWLLIAIALTTILASYFRVARKRAIVQALILTCFGTLIYVLFKLALGKFAQLVPHAVSPFADAWVSSLFLALFGCFLWLKHTHNHTAKRTWLTRLNAGFYLDEWATRITLALWPITLPAAKIKTKAKHLGHSVPLVSTTGP